MNYEEISTDTIITNHQQVGDTLVRMNDNTSHIKVKLDKLDRLIDELGNRLDEMDSIIGDGNYPTESRVDEMIIGHLEDHDVSEQVSSALDDSDYLNRDEVEEHVDQRIEYHTDDLPTKSDVESEVSDQLGNFDWSDVVYDEDLATKSYVDDEIEGQVEDAVKDASNGSQLFDLISKVLQAVDKDQFEVWVGVLKQSGVEEYKAEQAERERQAKLPELPKLPPLPTGPAIDSSASLLVDES